MLDEAEIIKAVTSASKGFIGDDATVLPNLQDMQYVMTKDLLLEDVHFRINYYSPKQLAHKSLHVNLSDIAAMGAKPSYIICGIAIPNKLELYAKKYINQLINACNENNITLIGGDTTASVDKLVISITAIGVADTNKVKYRHLAKAGDYICVAGNLGYAHLGLTALERNNLISQEFIDAFLLPTALLKEGSWLASKANVSSMMDVSDGLFVDLKRLCQSSNVGATIELDNFMYSQSYLSTCLALKLNPTEVALVGGEDYGLLFTVTKEGYNILAQEFLDKFAYKIKALGEITKEKNIILKEKQKNRILSMKPFTHFGEEV